MDDLRWPFLRDHPGRPLPVIGGLERTLRILGRYALSHYVSAA
jgi:hypothetical protein